MSCWNMPRNAKGDHVFVFENGQLMCVWWLRAGKPSIEIQTDPLDPEDCRKCLQRYQEMIHPKTGDKKTGICACCWQTGEVEWREDPYSAEILFIHDERWICEPCARESAMDI